MISLFNIFGAIFLINLWTFMAFGFDKMRAENGGWRVSEDGLLTLALFGGIMGAYVGRAIFRHKIRKEPFSRRLQQIAIFQCFICAIVSGWMFAG
ncbi:hypothetical protein LPB140_11910 [Sphingorhabdus lutea]|uniref:DUF1294 domain-containing protein n=1 Tax=Sphingorhabdus lutea TaxID=1913578 RepID=A0A1L3JE20_9SPHN|nr:DUF1294 domain-containing protein [Sphingorhabdus lutea]APG63375.1 hypothetical protein LPB140_11910 [Sphingorhabdus lutea]